MTVLKIAEITLEIWGAIFCLIAAFCIDLSKRVELRENIELGYMLAVNSIVLMADAFAIAFRGYPGVFGTVMVYAANCLVFADMYVLSYLSVRYIRALIRQSGGDIPKIFQKSMFFITIGSIILLTISQFNGLLYYIDQDNYYHRGQFWFLSQGPVCFGMIFLLIIILVYGRCIDTRERVTAFLYIALPVCAWFIQTKLYGISLVNIATTVSLLIMFTVYELGKSVRMVEQAEKLVEQEKRSHEWEMRILREQIQPHFIFNSMSVIQVLCRKDPEIAAEAIRKFSSFLRSSIDLYDKKESISLESEISILDNYLYLEKLRYGNKLQIEYQLDTTTFFVPAFSIQPIVENAIKHGIKPKLEGGTVKISSYETLEDYRVAVEDDGVGFDPQSTGDDGINHIGLKNVNSRIQLICGGHMEVDSTLGKGSCITIVIPKAF